MIFLDIKKYLYIQFLINSRYKLLNTFAIINYKVWFVNFKKYKGFVIFPLAATLLKNGAGMIQIIMFISTSTMVGVITISVEIKLLGKKVTYIRNLLALIFPFVIAYVMGVLMK